MNLIGLQGWGLGEMQRHWQPWWAMVMCGDAWQEDNSVLGMVSVSSGWVRMRERADREKGQR